MWRNSHAPVALLAVKVPRRLGVLNGKQSLRWRVNRAETVVIEKWEVLVLWLVCRCRHGLNGLGKSRVSLGRCRGVDFGFRQCRIVWGWHQSP